MQSVKDCFTLNNGVTIPCIGYGTWKTPDGDDTIKAVTDAIACGYRHIDTAQLYGNEGGVGKGIIASGVPREELFITTKLKNDAQGYDSTLKAFEESLKLLKLDYLDMFLIHWPIPVKYKENWQEVSRETWKAMERLYEEKLVRAIGLSNFLPHHIKNLAVTANVAPCIDQLEIHPYYPQQEAADYCRKEKIQVQAWSPLGHGSVLEDETLKKIGEKYGKTIAQVSLRWELQQDILPVPKSLNPGRMKQNTEVFDFSLTKEEVELITNLGNDRRMGSHPDMVTF